MILSSDHIRAQLARSLSSLREQEAALASSLASELAASNTSREASASAAGTTSAILKGDLDEVRSKVERVQKKVKEVESGEVGKAREGVRACLLSVLLLNLPFLTHVDSVTQLAVGPLLSRKNKDKPLDCWKETEQFKAAVSRLEQVRTPSSLLSSSQAARLTQSSSTFF